MTLNPFFGRRDIFDDLFFPVSTTGYSAAFTPEVDIYENNKHINVDMNCPGFNKEDMSVDLENNVLRISGKHKEREKEDGERFHRRERRYASFERAFTLPQYADTSKMRARYQNGVLHVSIDKKVHPEKEKEKRHVAIQ